MKLFFLIFISGLLAACHSPKNIHTSMKSAKTQVVAHRGAWKNNNLPQNSIASLKAAIALGCDGSETDVHMTADSFLVINHDNNWGDLTIQKHTLADVRKKKLADKIFFEGHLAGKECQKSDSHSDRRRRDRWELPLVGYRLLGRDL